MNKSRISSLIVESTFELMYSNGGFPIDKLAELDRLIKTNDSHLALNDLKHARYGSSHKRQILINHVVSYLMTLSHEYDANLQAMC